ncbi:hypothetical protein DPMN_026444 [Dreissena polymorpha]|uniref:Uncharacterized protein n=1 Tax=Dreissena polymorpha TaxID=45954 RepID=A0A9D4LSK5_DREPO|nr:hypothetical protein DPMN_026444 [Dreissena polymorpha]
MQESNGSAYRKRKHVDVDASGSLDLSMKKPYFETTSLPQSSTTASVDRPLDFSDTLKRRRFCTYQKKISASKIKSGAHKKERGSLHARAFQGESGSNTKCRVVVLVHAQDARTNEERRMDEFLKSLRLTKTKPPLPVTS